MKSLTTIILLLYSIHSFSQNRELKSSSQTTDSILKKKKSEPDILSKKNEDSINLKPSDTLKKSIFERVNKLDDVFIISKSNFDAVSLGIIDKEIKPLTQYERQLYTAGDFKPIHLLSILGGSLQIDPIINAISGRTKRLKKYIQFERKERNLMFLEEHYKDYIMRNLKVEKQLLGRFLNYLVENEKLQNLINRKDNGELYFFIGDQWFKFKKLQNDSPTLPVEEIISTKE